MTQDSRSHLVHEVVVGGGSNTVFNGLIAWLMLKSGPPMVWSGPHSFAVDIAATALLLPLIVALIVIPLQRKNLKLQRTTGEMIISASYEQPIDLKVTTYVYRFDAREKAPLF